MGIIGRGMEGAYCIRPYEEKGERRGESHLYGGWGLLGEPWSATMVTLTTTSAYDSLGLLP